jgi:hypothetical protein
MEFSSEGWIDCERVFSKLERVRNVRATIGPCGIAREFSPTLRCGLQGEGGPVFQPVHHGELK